MLMKRQYRRKTTMERFLRSFLKTEGNECWEWLKKLDRDGYGQMTFHMQNGDRVTKKAHRVAYEILIGSIAEGMCVCHKCDNPSCVNPDHLFLGTQQDNMLDKKNKKRHHFGERHPMAKLTHMDVLEIKNLANNGLTHQLIARKFNVCRQTVGEIVNGKSWPHLEVANG